MTTCSILSFPCTYVGADEYYGVDLEDFLLEEGGDLISSVWKVPAGLTITDQKVEGNVVYIKLLALSKGVYTIKLTITSGEGLITQDTINKYKIRVEN